MERGAGGALDLVVYYRLALLGMALKIARERLVPPVGLGNRVETG